MKEMVTQWYDCAARLRVTGCILLINIHENQKLAFYTYKQLQTAILHGSIHCPNKTPNDNSVKH